MTTTSILITTLCALSGLGALQAEEAVQAAISAPAPKQAHPFYEDSPYPAWSQMTAEQGLADTRAALRLAEERIAAICALKTNECTFDNTFLAFYQATEKLDTAQGYMHHLSSVMDNPAMRQAQESLIPELSRFSASVTANEQLWQVIKAAAAQPWVKELSPAKQRFVQQVVDSFRDSGADLPADKKARKAEIEQELSQLTHQFGKNVLDSTNAWELVITDKAELAGMRDDWLAKAAASARQKGYGSDEAPAWRISLEYTSFGEVMRDCTVEATRKKCWEGQCTIGKGGAYDNERIVARIMELRRELAELLGFKTYADLTTAHRMVGSGDKAMAFVDGMMSKVKPFFDKECAEVLDYISRCKGEKVNALNPWDRRFYMNKMAKELYDFDPEALRPYHLCDNVIRGMFAIFSHLYDISFEEIPTICLQPGETCPEGKVETWHPEVKLYKVKDNKTGAHLGSFYMDLFPRETKRSGAWVMPMRFGAPGKNGQPHQPHLATLVGNLSPAVGDKPALFSHYDVETLFHEFGHMMHNMLTDTELQSQAGSSVAWDFVELPSQLNENWTWEPEGIAAYAFHYETGAPIPSDLVKKLQASRYFLPATDNMGQLCIAKLDLEMHVHYNEKFKGKGLDASSHELLAPWRIASTVPSPSIMRNLTHCITGGYSAGYYSYKWAEVLAADAFTRFKNEGVMNAKTGADYRASILRQGDSKPASDVYRDFMGREPNPDALLQSQGLH